MRASSPRPRLAAAAVYVLVLVAFLAEKSGQTTTDTKASLVVAPGELLRSTLSLWTPQTSLGELQNQAYGYLFPMGPFFAGLHGLGVPDWVTQRLWSWVIVVLACEGARLVCRQLGISPWPALGAGLAYGLNVRILSEVGVRSAEVLPTAVLPWMLLPILWALRGRLDPRLAALWSVTAYLFSGAINGTVTIAPLPVMAVFIVWGVRRGLVRWSMLGWWSGLVVLASLWWGSSLVQLGGYSPPFFDYVEDARTTTSVTGFDASLRGASNWVGYLTTAGEPSWPSAWSLNYEPVLVLATGLISAISVVGLVMFRSRWRTPLVICSVIGLTCLTIGHTSEVWSQSPLAEPVQRWLDEPFALLRNVAKIDPVLRLPLAVGFGVALSRMGVAVASLAERGRRVRSRGTAAALVGACLLVVVAAQPVYALNTRTPGWEEVPSYWAQTARYLDDQPGQNGAWVVPGAGFGIQTWGWTADEPMSLVARSPWVTRSQVPLAPPETIRMLSTLEDLLETGSGSARLGEMLQRIGLGYVVLRRDLDPSLDDGVPANVVATALAKSSGIRRVATFGQLDLGPAVEVYEVIDRDRGEGSDLRVVDAASQRTVGSGPADVLAAVGAGLLTPDQAAGVTGDPAVPGPSEVVGDGYQERERQFGRVHANEGPVLADGEPHRAFRWIENYPGSPGASPVVADYHGARYVEASSSQGYPDSLGAIRSETAPYAAVDGDAGTGWTSAYGTRPRGQWWQVSFRAARPFGALKILGDPDAGGSGVRSWRVSAGGTSVVAEVDPLTHVATADLGGVRSDVLRVSVASTGGSNSPRPVTIREITGNGFPVERSLVVPAPAGDAVAAYLFGARPETRACASTLLGPDCDPGRFRPAEEAQGIDREVTFPKAAQWSVSGTVVARTDPSVMRLIDPFGGRTVMRGSSTYYDDPAVSARMAYDGTAATSWIANAQDPSPTLVVEFSRPTRVDRLEVDAPAAPGVRPTVATLVAGGVSLEVRLDGFARFEAFTTKRLEIRFANPSRPGEPLGVGEIRLGPTVPAVAFDGTAATGIGCGFGPNVFVDGRRYLTRVTGRMGDVVDSGPLALELCGAPIAIPAGEHRIRVESTVEFQPVRVLLQQPGSLATGATSDRAATVLENTDTRQRVRVGSGEASLLVTARNWNAGWAATLDGKKLTAQRIDGWAQGWQLPAGAGGVVTVSFEPQQAYRIGLLGGLGIVAVLFLAALGFAARVRLKPPAELVETPSGSRLDKLDERMRRRTTLLVLGGAVLAGLPGLVGVTLARVLHRWALLVAGVLLVAAPTITAIALADDGPRSVPDVANLVAAIGAALALALALRPDEEESDEQA